MARSFRDSRFRGKRDIGEDVNPSAYIVNLADCMLVLALGFMVALIAYWNVDIVPVTDLEDSDLQEVDPSTLPEEALEGGSYYVDAGKVYQDPNTGELFMVENVDEDGNTVASKNAKEGDGTGTTAEQEAAASGDSDSSSDSADASSSGTDATAARANGAD